jgi:hypothetical protein
MSRVPELNRDGLDNLNIYEFIVLGGGKGRKTFAIELARKGGKTVLSNAIENDEDAL